MSNFIYPILPGLKPSIKVKPEWKNDVIEAWSGAETVLGRRQYPRYAYTLGYEVLRSAPAFAERQLLLAFFNFHRGRGESFLFVDEEDNAVTDERFGTTDGVATLYQLTRTMAYGGMRYQEPVFGYLGTPEIRCGKKLLAPGQDYTLSDNGQVTFASPGAAGQDLTWTGAYAMRVRFSDDTLEFDRFLQGLWQTANVTLISKVYP